MSAKRNAAESLSCVNAMAEESLDPETFGKWEDVMRVLKASRGDLAPPVTGESWLVGEPRTGKNYEAGLWSRRNWEAMVEDQNEVKT